MRKTLVYGAATAIVLASLGAGTGLSRCSQPVETVYGPPPIEEPSDDPAAGQTGNQQGTTNSGQDDPDEPVETLYGPPPSSYDDPDEPVQDFYGPPVVFEEIDAEE